MRGGSSEKRAEAWPGIREVKPNGPDGSWALYRDQGIPPPWRLSVLPLPPVPLHPRSSIFPDIIKCFCGSGVLQDREVQKANRRLSPWPRVRHRMRTWARRGL